MIDMQILPAVFAVALIPNLCAIFYLYVKSKKLLAIVGLGHLPGLSLSSEAQYFILLTCSQVHLQFHRYGL